MSPREYAHRVYRFGDFRVDLDRGTLYHGEREVHLRPKSFAVLRRPSGRARSSPSLGS